MNKRIAILSHGHPEDPEAVPHGSMIQSYVLAQEFAALGHEVHYVTPTSNRFGLGAAAQQANPRVHCLQESAGQLGGLKLSFQIFQHLSIIRPDIVYSRGRSYFAYVAAQYSRRSHARFIWASNADTGCDLHKFAPKLWASRRPFYRKLVLHPWAALEDAASRRAIRMAHVCVNQTEIQSEALQRNYGRRGLIIPSAHPERPHRLKSSAPGMVLWAATLAPGKRPERFVDLARDLSYLKDWEFVLVGGTPDRQYLTNLEAASKGLSNLRLAGAVPFNQIGDYFDRASIFVCTSDHEGLPNTYVQAWLAGAPVVSLNVDPDHLLSRQRLGCCANGNVNEFHAAVLRLIEQRAARDDISARARTYAVETFSAHRVAVLYEALFG
jgi:glycosyltransferase involved in cell wall biosynthesis